MLDYEGFFYKALTGTGRAIDSEGNLVDVYLSNTRNQPAAENFFKQAAKTSGMYPDKITTDKEPAFYPAIESVFGDYTDHRDNKYLNNIIEQSHRGIKSRYRVLKSNKLWSNNGNKHRIRMEVIYER